MKLICTSTILSKLTEIERILSGGFWWKLEIDYEIDD
jgi:hypothetical protein